MLGTGGMDPPFLTVALDGAEWSASSPYRFTPRQIASTALWIGGWVRTRASLHTEEKKNSAFAENRTPAFQRVTCRYADWGISASAFFI
jgi:hypothetical protein